GLLLLGFGAAKALTRGRTAVVSSSVDADSNGYLAGKYQMVRIIGRGGMGEVYEALDRSLNRPVAIKKLSAGLASEIESKLRGFLLKEARIVAALHHPAIVDIYEILERGSDIYLVFEFVRGKTLQQILVENRRLGLEPAVN